MIEKSKIIRKKRRYKKYLLDIEKLKYLTIEFFLSNIKGFNDYKKLEKFKYDPKLDNNNPEIHKNNYVISIDFNIEDYWSFEECKRQVYRAIAKEMGPLVFDEIFYEKRPQEIPVFYSMSKLILKVYEDKISIFLSIRFDFETEFNEKNLQLNRRKSDV